MSRRFRTRNIWIGAVLVLTIGVVALLALPFWHSGDRPEAAARYQLSVVHELLQRWHQQRGGYPSQLAELDELLAAGTPSESRARLRRDPWGDSFTYHYPPTDPACRFQLYSNGPNHRDDAGTADDIGVDSEGRRPGCPQ